MDADTATEEITTGTIDDQMTIDAFDKMEFRLIVEQREKGVPIQQALHNVKVATHPQYVAILAARDSFFARSRSQTL